MTSAHRFATADLASRVLSALRIADDVLRGIVDHGDGERPPDADEWVAWRTPEDGVEYARTVISDLLEEALTQEVD